MIGKIIFAIVMWLSSFIPHRTETIGITSFDYNIKQYGTVIEQTYEGCYEGCDDDYIVELANGTLIDIVADDLQPGDPVTIYWKDGAIIHTLYDYR